MKGEGGVKTVCGSSFTKLLDHRHISCSSPSILCRTYVYEDIFN